MGIGLRGSRALTKHRSLGEGALDLREVSLAVQGLVGSRWGVEQTLGTHGGEQKGKGLPAESESWVQSQGSSMLGDSKARKYPGSPEEAGAS